MAYSVHVKGVRDADNTNMVKLQLIFYKSGYNRVPKTITVTGLSKNWDPKSESFVGTSNGNITKNQILLDLKTKYINVAEEWEKEGRNWSPIEWSHCFEQEEKTKVPEAKVKSVLQMIDSLEEKFRNKKRIKNGQIIDSLPNARKYAQIRRLLQTFTKEKYNRALSTYYFKDITETFLLDLAFSIKEQGIRNGNRAGLTSKLRLFRAICNAAMKEGMYGASIEIFKCLGNDINFPETTSKAVADTTIAKIENIDRTLFTKKEKMYLDLFLFSYYTGGMANIDVCYLTWDSVQEDRIVYERIKFPKTAKPILIKKAKVILDKYHGTGIENFVFPIFTVKHVTSKQKAKRVSKVTEKVNKTIAKACRLLNIKEHITWYSARGSFISKMVDAGNNPYIVAEMAGNSPLTIYKHYYKNTKKEELKKAMEEMF